MHTKLIRNLLIVFTVLLVFVSADIAVSAQEVNTEPLVVDLSASSSTRYVFDPENNHTDSYIVTGSNPDAEIIVNSSCNITLRNATFRRIEVDYSDSYDINITLEGTNTIDQYNWASQAALGIYSSNVVIFGGETDSLYANSKTFTAYSSSHDLGALTVEGGNITFRSFGGGAPFQTNYIQNGGNVTVIEEDYSQSFLYDVQLNGGSLEVINNKASSGAVFVGDVKLKNGVSLKVSVPNMPYLVSGLIGLADDAVADDCMFVRFDNSSDFVYLNDDNNALAGKSYFEIKVVDHTHICENGICYCGFICEHDTDGGTCGICGKYIYKIVHQPTEAEPYVQLNDGTNAVYKWYKTNYTEITDKSDILSWQIFGAPFPDSYSYSKTDGWTGIPLYYDEESGEQYIYYFVKNYNAGEEIVLNFSSPVIYLELFNDEDYIEFEITGNVAKGVTENAGDYGLMVITDGSEPTLKAYVTDGVKTVIANETQAELIAPSYGSYYICEVTADDGSILISSILDFSYKITHQPTETETYVELNCSEDANYQWYRVTEDREYITNENADSFEILGAPPEIGGTYNEVDGWTPDEYGYYFVVWLNQGQNLTFDFSEIPSVIYCLYSSVAGDVEDELIIYSDTLIAQADGYYAIFVEESTAKLQACISNTRMDVLNGQTGSKLTLNDTGNFCCEVTFKNGTTEISEIVAMTHIHVGGTATCMAPAVCQVCLQSYSSIDADAHKWDNGRVTTTATCKVNGVKTYTCQHNSQHTYTENLGLDTSNHVNTKATDAVAATCSSIGYTAGVYCNDCESYISGHSEIGIDADAHKWDNGKVTTTATCKVNGVKTYTCQHNSQHTYTEKLGVNTSNHVNTKNVAEEKATCTAKGSTAGVICNDCQKYISGHKEISALGHSYKDTVTAPTCTKEGYTTHSCARCSDFYIDTKVKATGHKWGEWEEVSAPTFTSNGTEERSCSLCKKTESRYTDKLSFDVGDLDGNGIITAADARIALRSSVGLENLSDSQKLSADVDNNGSVTAADARLILRASVGLEDLKKYKK